jgi:hypothetical protein
VQVALVGWCGWQAGGGVGQVGVAAAEVQGGREVGVVG